MLGANGKPPEFFQERFEDDPETQKQNEVKHEEADEAQEEEVGKRGMFLQKKQKQSEPENGELTLSSSSAMSVEESDDVGKDWQKPQGWKDPLFEDGSDPWKHCQ